MAGERILIVEDDRAVARGVEYGLAAEGFTVLRAANGREALDLARTGDPHLILLDIRLPDISGFEICRQLRAEGKRQPILILTARDEEVDRVLGLELGADDYVVKPFSLREIVARIRALIRRSYGDLSTGGAERIVFDDLEIDATRLTVTRAGRPIDLTPIEFRLLRHLVSHPNRPLSRDALIEAVWGYSGDLGSARTIDVHIRHLREKLEADPADPRRIVTVRGVGYKFERWPPGCLLRTLN